MSLRRGQSKDTHRYWQQRRRELSRDDDHQYTEELDPVPSRARKVARGRGGEGWVEVEPEVGRRRRGRRLSWPPRRFRINRHGRPRFRSRTVININAFYLPLPPRSHRASQASGIRVCSGLSNHVKRGSSLEKSVVVLVNGNSLQTEPSKAQRPLEHVLVYLR